MLTLEDAEKEIESLMHQKATFPICEKIAAMIVIRNYLMEEKEIAKAEKEQDDEVRDIRYDEIARADDSEFIMLCNKLEKGTVISVINKHMANMKITCPYEYWEILMDLREKM